tara:strand:- start:1417 stop:2109 length:693 start_codon:yes stop_codon:yes gene_type:complete
MKKIIVFSGAGISAESGLKTFRDSDGLWENFQISEVATLEAWNKNPEFVLDFYNIRRKQVIDSSPNQAHFTAKDLEKHFDMQIITQNIDDLHERAGSQNILHLHGEILKAKSSKTDKQYKINGPNLNIGDICEDNFQLRPDIVWFGEAVPNMEIAENICKNADILIIIGTSLSVYPAANIIDFVTEKCETFLIDPKEIVLTGVKNLTVIKEKASIGFPILANNLINKYAT